MVGLLEGSRLGIRAFEEIKPVELRPNYTEADLQTVVVAAYRQVMGNEHLMSRETAHQRGIFAAPRTNYRSGFCQSHCFIRGLPD